MKKVLNIAHRGASFYETENTIPAFKKALEQGADGIELDIHQSKDGFFIVYHNNEITLESGKKQIISEMTLSEIKEINLYKGGKIPTLDNVLELFGKNLLINIEIKQKNLENDLISFLKKWPLQSNIYISSFDLMTLVSIKKLDPSLKTGLITGLPNLNEDLRKIIEQLILYVSKNKMVDFIAEYYELIKIDLIEQVHGYHLPIYAWAVDDIKVMKKLIRDGIDGIVTNRPDILHGVRLEN